MYVKNMIIFVPIILVFTSCNSIYIIRANNKSYEELNKKFKYREVTVQLLSGDSKQGTNVHVQSDSTRIGQTTVPTNKISKFKLIWHCQCGRIIIKSLFHPNTKEF